MHVLEPNNFDYSQIISSIPEDAAPAWSASESYAKDDKVRVDMYLYSSLQDSNSGHEPPSSLSGLDAYWRRLGPTNRGAMFDEHLYTQTVAPEGTTQFSVSVPWSRGTSAFAILNISETSVIHAVVKSLDGTILWDNTYDLLEGVDNWWDYYAGFWDYRSEFVEESSTPLISGTLTVTFTGGNPSIGHMIVGSTWEPGATLYDVTAEIKDYSVYNTDEFGNLTVIQRNFVKIFSGTLYLHPARADATFRKFIQSRAKLCLWIGDNRTTNEGGHEALNCLGYFKSAPLVFSGPNECRYNLKIEGII